MRIIFKRLWLCSDCFSCIFKNKFCGVYLTHCLTLLEPNLFLSKFEMPPTQAPLAPSPQNLSKRDWLMGEGDLPKT